MTKIVPVSRFKRLAESHQHLHLLKHDFKSGRSRLVFYDYEHKDCLYATPLLTRDDADLLYSQLFFTL